MSLFFKGQGAAEVSAAFARVSDLTGPSALRHMRQVSKLIMEQSQKNCPRDFKGPHGRHSMPGLELERAHHIEEEYGDMRRIESSIEVGGDVDGVNVDDYAEIMEQGSYNLGPASIQKMAENGCEVGEKYLERAVIQYDVEFDNILEDLADAMMRAF